MASQPASQHYTLETLAEGVYAAIHKDGGSAISNAGLIDLGDATLVVDTFITPTAAEALRLDSQRLTGRLPRWVVDTHYHNDHIWGSQVFLPEADLISTVKTRELIDTAGREEYESYRAITDQRLKDALAGKAAATTDEQRASFDLWIGYFSGLQRDFPRLQVMLPNLVFQDRLVLYGSRRRAELISFSDAHTGSDTLVYLPDDGIVFMSDLLFVGFHPYMGDGNPDGCIRVLRSIMDGSAGIPGTSCFVPGHGPAARLADLQGLVDYIQASQELARHLVAAGKTSQADIESTPIPEAYARWTMPRFFHANLRFLVEQYQNEGRPSEPVKHRPLSNSFRP